MNDTDLYAWARTRARRLRAFYLHAGVYFVVILFLVFVNAMTRDDTGGYMYRGYMHHRDAGDWWVVWPALGWGAAVAIHGLVVALGATDRFDAWEDRKVAELVRREKAHARTPSAGSDDEDPGPTA
jgi:hypothetical protein